MEGGSSKGNLPEVGRGVVPAAVTAEWVREQANAAFQKGERYLPFKLVDASWFLNPPPSPHSPQVEGAIFFSVDDIADQLDPSPSPHMLPTQDQFGEWMDKLGISRKDHIVVYDHSAGALVASARVWWTFKVFGHDKVSVFLGGYQQWPKDVSLPPQPATPISPDDEYSFSKDKRFVKELVWNKDDVLRQVVQSKQYVLLDARPPDRFKGEGNEPRLGVPSGHVPNTTCLTSTDLFHKRDEGGGQVSWEPKTKTEILDLLASRGVTLDNADCRVATMCGSGVTGAVVAFMLHLLGREGVPVYDGSWTDWAFAPAEVYPKENLQTLPEGVTPKQKYTH